METSKELKNKLFELFPLSQAAHGLGGVIPKKRTIVGRVESCDIKIPNPAISSVHAIIEISGEGGIIYDMNSTNGTFVNGKKIVSEKIKIGDKVQFANIEFTFKEYSAEELPPILDILESRHGAASVISSPKKLPLSTPNVSDVVPSVVYPLEKDKKAELSEYIFEEENNLYPIFKYEVGKYAVEIIILYDDVVYSVDYLPAIDQSYHLSGFNATPSVDIEFPYFSKNEKVPFVNVKGNEIYINKLTGYDVLFLGDTKSTNVQSVFKLGTQDIVRFDRGALQIFVRNVDAPPKVAVPPFLRRDKSFFLILLFSLIATAVLIILTLSYKVDIEIEQEKIPERLAKVLIKTRPIIKKNPEPLPKVEATPKVESIKPNPTAVKAEEKREVEKVSTKEESFKKAGDKVAKKEEQVKQATVKDDGKRPQKLEAKAAGGKSSPNPSGAILDKPNPGIVDTYKSVDFSSSLNANLARSGKSLKDSVATGSGKGTGTGSLDGPGSGSVFGGSGNVDNLKRADVTSSGSLIGSSSGKLTASKGAEGLSSKEGVADIGIPKEVVFLGNDPSEIRKRLRAKEGEFRHCYQKELETTQNKEEFQGIVQLNFVVGASGYSKKESATSDAKLTPEIRKCIVNVLKGIEFPKPVGESYEVNQAMNFFPRRER